jgi:hypothetical protein
MLFLLACTPASESLLFELAPMGDQVDLLQHGALRLQPDGPDVSAVSRDARDTLPVVDWLDDQVQVLWTGRDVELSLWIPRDTLQSYVVHEVWAEAPGGGDAGVLLPEWLPVDAGPGMDGEQWVSHPDGLLEAWLPAGAVDQVVPEDHPVGQVAAIYGSGWWLHSDADVFDAPEGQVWAQVGAYPEGFFRSIDVLDQVDGWAEIWWDAPYGLVRGWVQDDDVLYEPMRGVGWSTGHSSFCGGGGAWSVYPHNLLAGTLLFDDLGEPIGQVTHDTRMELGPVEHDGWRSVWVPTDWGDLELWLEPGSAVEADWAM